jgi:hypothetical protein
MPRSNNAPVVKWFGFTLSCGILRQRLFINGVETPFFVDTAPNSSHRTYGKKHGLFGAGMGEEIQRHDGSSYRIAATLASSNKIAGLKHNAEQQALSCIDQKAAQTTLAF